MIYSILINTLFALTVPQSSALPAAADKKSVPQVEDAKETLGCKRTGGKKTDIAIDYLLAKRVILATTDKGSTYMVPGSGPCIKSGEIHKIVLTETGQHIADAQVDILGQPTSLRTMYSDVNSIKDKHPEILDTIYLAAPLFALSFPEVKDSDPIHELKITKIARTPNFLNYYTRIVPLTNRYAKSLDLEAVAKMVAIQKPFIVDTRAPQIFRIWHLPNAKNFPVLRPPSEPGLEVNFSQLMSLQGSVPLKDLPKDHEQPILVMSDSEINPSAFYVADMLYLSGYKNLYWYRGGEHDWQRIYRTMPDGRAPDDVESIDSKTLEGNLSKYALIDTRDNTSFRAGNISGSKNVYYGARSFPLIVGVPYGSNYFIGDYFDTGALPKDRSKPLVFIGQDEADWAAVLATGRARDLGYHAYWYKGGAAEWMSLSKWFSQTRFPVTGW